MSTMRSIVLAALLVWAVLTPSFLSMPSLTALLTTASVIGCMAAGMTFITVGGNVMSFALGATAAASAFLFTALLNVSGFAAALAGSLSVRRIGDRYSRSGCRVAPRQSYYHFHCRKHSDLWCSLMADGQRNDHATATTTDQLLSGAVVECRSSF